MSFTTDINKELTTKMPERKCCQLAEIALYLRFSGAITLGMGGVGLKSVTGSAAVARYFLALINGYFGIRSDLEVTRGGGLSQSRSYSLKIDSAANSDAILRECGILSVREGSNYFTDSISPAIIKKKCCKKAALKGIFMAAGSVSDPLGKGYHLELRCSSETLAKDVEKLLESLEINAKYMLRKEKYVIYLKNRDDIADFLSLIGATSNMLHLRDAQVIKDVRNSTIRAQNCEMANLEKSVNAAQKQLADIHRIEGSIGLDSLPLKLRQTAQLRLENPSLGLAELAELFDPPIGKSGLNHRFEKLAAIANGPGTAGEK